MEVLRKKRLPTLGNDPSAIIRASGTWHTSKDAGDILLSLLFNTKSSHNSFWPSNLNFRTLLPRAVSLGNYLKKRSPTFGDDRSAVLCASGTWCTSKDAEDVPLNLLLNTKSSQNPSWPSKSNFSEKRFGELGQISKLNHFI